MSTLNLPGALLSCETRGSGPLTVMVPEANGTAASFKRLAEHHLGYSTIVT